MSFPLFRAVKTLSPIGLDEFHGWRSTLRLPSNVPYVVDNLWEFLRPSTMPCRRHAVYASPTAELALECAARPTDRHAYTPYVVKISGTYKVAQLDVDDARDHPDIREVQRHAQQQQASWQSLPWDTRLRLAMFFAPGCVKADWERVVEEDEVVATFVAELSKLSTFWSSVRSTATTSRGELFFELTGGATYQLQTLAGF